MASYEILFIIGIILAVIAGAFLVTTVIMFFKFSVPSLRRDVKGVLEKRQLEEIRENGRMGTRHKESAEVFIALEKKAKLNKTPNRMNYALKPMPTQSVETSVLNKGGGAITPNFIVEKNIIFVSTSDVL